MSDKVKRKIHKIARHKFTYIVLFPLLLAIFYNVFVATNRYGSSAKILVKQFNIEKGGAGFQLGLIGSISNGFRDAMIVERYIYSMEMFEYLVKEIGLIDHYKLGASFDPFVIYWPWYSKESGLEYYSQFVDIKFDHEGEVLNIEVQAFTPEFAQKQLEVMIRKSEQFINQIGNDLATSQVSFFEQELKREQERMRIAKNEMLLFQENHGLLSPEDQSKAAVAVVNELKAEQTRLQTEIETLSAYMNPDAPQVQKIRDRLHAIQQRIKGEHESYAKAGPDSLNSLTAKFRDYILSYSFAEDSYKLALKSLEEARIESYRKKNFLVMISKPFLPEISKYPTKFRNLITFAIVLLCLYGIFVISYEIMKENA